MIFSSYSFILIFLPVALVGYSVSTRLGPRAAALWLGLCSIVFYALWNVFFVSLLVLSIIFNFSIGTTLIRNEENENLQNILLTVGIAGNLSVLFFFKYFAAVFSSLANMGLIHYSGVVYIILPLGISFFTFTQIGYLVDCRQGVGKALGFLHYFVFVTFFPHLIAGPILHIREIGPQLAAATTYQLRTRNVAIGISFFVLGLSKKVLLADPLALLADTGFSRPSGLDFSGGWFAALSYSVQLYFDFSGYSDMAIGLAYMFGIKFPINFNSPYKARDIIDFWQRWHITLTRYLTLLLFNPLALWITRRRMAKGKTVRAKPMPIDAFVGVVIFPTVYTMFLAGIWHGAGLQFIVFGLLHALYLSINHSWRTYGPHRSSFAPSLVRRTVVAVAQVAITYLCVLVAQIFFRSSSVGGAMSMLSAMTGGHGFDPFYLPASLFARLGSIGQSLRDGGWITTDIPQYWPPRNPAGLLIRYIVIFFLPNTQQIMSIFAPYLDKVETPKWRLLLWEPNPAWAIAISVMLFLDLISLNYSPPFLYFQF